ncbi:hypothetical protein GLOIN_2v1774286 [Rhizophagus irregularis DAOM 181602=DAOM 197198]|uniref:Uncharacterized protein n=1 Tax=Rhizophagus irregularis (strain DAOM 181602 / DAOM 197198 / MUCL 43194) TaxID=747089 RepID=A0A2P4Q2T7_RHIID|nr:hypothetical protein GLOIN_2v1774286 [Rhizophagus irregularis DAOM 181602=DAOM 197198]POG71902.1 hypothetical protein GLOIN_2v1774286 [Rhizophagus irregularis DAOM 181602=DAOM 197198]|eukprot:XP_025178768.1 hypothetical protein GLOIN_2v1774286 [Rhizophagus irregularis DAOM 181602=DAOM 197198]
MYVNIIQVKFQGCDCHGLSIELKALTELRDVDKSSLMTLQIREVAKVALEALQIQRKEFVRVLMENPYRTLINEYEVKQLQVFYLHDGEITALAEAELEYRDDYQNKSVYIQSSHKLIGTTYIRPISEKQCSVIDASHITEESGTEVGESTFEGKLVLTFNRWNVDETVIPLLTDSSIEHIIEIFKKHESVGWWELDDQELLAPEYKNNVAVNDKASYSTLIAHGFVMDVLAILEKSSKSRD